MSATQHCRRARVPGCRLGAPRAGDIRLEQPLLEQLRGLAAFRDQHELRVAVERPGVEVERAEADHIVGDHDLRVHDRSRELPDLDARLGQLGVAEPERGAGLGIVRPLGDEHAHVHPAPGGGEDPADRVLVGQVGVRDVEALARGVDLLEDRLRGRDVASRDHLGERDRRRAGVVGLRKEASGIGRQRAAAIPEGGQEGGLRLPHDVAGDAHHHVVEAAVLEVILEAGSPGPGDRSVDHVELAMVYAAQLAVAPGPPLAVGEEPAPIDR